METTNYWPLTTELSKISCQNSDRMDAEGTEIDKKDNWKVGRSRIGSLLKQNEKDNNRFTTDRFRTKPEPKTWNQRAEIYNKHEKVDLRANQTGTRAIQLTKRPNCGSTAARNKTIFVTSNENNPPGTSKERAEDVQTEHSKETNRVETSEKVDEAEPSEKETLKESYWYKEQRTVNRTRGFKTKQKAPGKMWQTNNRQHGTFDKNPVLRNKKHLITIQMSGRNKEASLEHHHEDHSNSKHDSNRRNRKDSVRNNKRRTRDEATKQYN